MLPALLLRCNACRTACRTAALLLLAVLASAAPLSVQAQSPSETDLTSAYERAESLLSWNTQDKVYRASVQPHWFAGNQFWYRVQIEDGHEFMRVNPAQEMRTEAFDHEQLATAIETVLQEDNEAATVAPYDLPFSTFEYVDDQAAITFTHNESVWRCDIESYTCEVTGSDPKADLPTAIESPDGTYAAYIKDHNLWVRNLETGNDTQLTTDGEEHYGYAVDSQGWRRSDMPILKWSPNSPAYRHVPAR